jgi:hypothetical protein
VTSILEDSLPVVAILIVLLSMTLVDLFLILDAARTLTVVPILLLLLLWAGATWRVRRRL